MAVMMQCMWPALIVAAQPDWQCLTALQASPAMVSSDALVPVSFSLAGMNVNGTTTPSWELSLKAANGTEIHSVMGQGAGKALLPPLGCDGCLYSWEARWTSVMATGHAISDWSPPQSVFTAPWTGGLPAPVGMWAQDNATKTGPQFAFLRAELPPSLVFGGSTATVRATHHPSPTTCCVLSPRPTIFTQTSP